MLSNFKFVIAVTLMVGVGPVAIGQPPPPPKPQPVQVTEGKPITLTDSLKGYDLKRYSFQGKAKRTLNLQVTSARGNWLMIRVCAASSSEGNDLFNNSIDNALVWKGVLPEMASTFCNSGYSGQRLDAVAWFRIRQSYSSINAHAEHFLC